MKKNRCLNALKGIACLLVVLNHFHGSDENWGGQIVYTISHIGVPIFFMVSGYYLYNNDITVIVKKLPGKMKHIFRLLLVHFLLYFMIGLLQAAIGEQQVLAFLSGIFSWKGVIKSLFLSESFYGVGQWFLIALLQDYIFFYIVYKYKIKMIYNHLAAVMLMLFMIHIVVRPLVVLSGIDRIAGISLLATPCVRNWFFDGLPFLCVGMLIHQYEEKIRLSNSKLCMLTLASVFFSCMEDQVMRFLIPEAYNVLYVGTLCSCILLFLFAVKNEDCFINTRLEFIGENLSMTIYFIHPLIGKAILIVMNKILNIVPYVLFDIVSVIIIMIATSLISYIWYYFIRNLKKIGIDK